MSSQVRRVVFLPEQNFLQTCAPMSGLTIFSQADSEAWIVGDMRVPASADVLLTIGPYTPDSTFKKELRQRGFAQMKNWLAGMLRPSRLVPAASDRSASHLRYVYWLRLRSPSCTGRAAESRGPSPKSRHFSARLGRATSIKERSRTICREDLFIVFSFRTLAQTSFGSHVAQPRW